MGVLALIAILAALNPAVAATPSASPAPSATSAPIARCLLHICLGDSINQVFAQLGDGTPPSRLPPGIFSNFDSFGSLTFTQQFAGGAVVGLSIELVRPETTKTLDPYGVAIGNSTDTLLRIRGTPDQTGYVWRYGPPDGAHWLYAIIGGTVSSISVTSLENVSY